MGNSSSMIEFTKVISDKSLVIMIDRHTLETNTFLWSKACSSDYSLIIAQCFKMFLSNLYYELLLSSCMLKSMYSKCVQIDCHYKQLILRNFTCGNRLLKFSHLLLTLQVQS